MQLRLGSNIVAVFSGTVTYAGFNGSGGYTITITKENLTASYCHVSPLLLVFVGQYVEQGYIIAHVGPKNVYGISDNPYHDSDGNPTNGATTGSHLHFSLRENDKSVNPLNYF